MSANLAEVPQQTAPTLKFPGIDWCELTKLGLKVHRQSFKFEEWENTLPHLTVAEKGSQFGVGDWLVLGEARHGEKCAQAIDGQDKTGINPKTLMEYRRVSEKVPYSLRRESLEWYHHKEVASCKTRTERKQWLDLAEEEGLSSAELRRRIRDAHSSRSTSRADSDYLDPHYKTFLLDYIATQHAFLNKCNYEPFKRVIEHTIRVANFQRARTANSDRESVRDQVDQGACTVEEIAEEVYLSDVEIDAFCLQLVGCPRPTKATDQRKAETDYEWRPIGANTEMAKGSRSYGIFRKDAPSGDVQLPGVRSADYDSDDF